MSPKAVRPRRAHRKSRLGCADCKRRRIKCDEKRPSCSNCTNHAIECSFSGEIPTPDTNVTSESPEAIEPRPRPARFRPQKFPNGGVKQAFRISRPSRLSPDPPTNLPQNPPPDLSTNPPSNPPTPDQHVESLQTESLLSPSNPYTQVQPETPITLLDLQLIHNYTFSTHQTMRISDSQNLWQSHLVNWSFSFPSLLHLILALSALHMAYQHPQQRDTYIARADAHFTFGIRSVTAVLGLLNEENCQQVYMAASLICFIYFGRGPREGEYLVFSDKGQAEWLVLMNGVKSIVETYHGKVFTGVLGPGNPEEEERTRLFEWDIRGELHENSVHVEAVRRFVERDMSGEEGRICVDAVDGLLEIMREVYEITATGCPGVGIMHLMMGWLYRRPAEMIRLLEEKEPHALIVLGYWAVMLRFMETSWFMEGWAVHVLSGVSKSLHPDFRYWIEWPLQRVGVREIEVLCYE